MTPTHKAAVQEVLTALREGYPHLNPRIRITLDNGAVVPGYVQRVGFNHVEVVTTRYCDRYRTYALARIVTITNSMAGRGRRRGCYKQYFSANSTVATRDGQLDLVGTLDMLLARA